MMKTRNIHLDMAKGLCLILMIAGHTKGINQTLYHLIYSFHMPAFFIISGMTHGASKSDIGSQIWSKFKRLIIPAWIFGLINGIPFLFRLIRGGMGSSEFLSRLIGTLTGAAQVSDTFNCTPLWFLYAMFLVYVFEAIAASVLVARARVVLAAAIVVLLCVDPLSYQSLAPVQVKYALTGILFFQLGVLLKDALVAPKEGNTGLWLLVSFLAWILPASYSPTLGLNSGNLGAGYWVLLSLFVALAGTFFIIKLCQMMPPMALLQKLAQVSLPVVGLNYLIEQRLNVYLTGGSLFLVETLILVAIAFATLKGGRVGRALNGRI
ncbi:acyltransferase family protein [Herbaspirillum rubrisubalbicans]|nr:acyltransferase family protein [Herbaspirillum rubrisubalbicans]